MERTFALLVLDYDAKVLCYRKDINGLQSVDYVSVKSSHFFERFLLPPR